MITQQIKLNLIPGQVLPRVNASQYDSNSRTLQMLLYDGDQVFNIASGMNAFVQGTKPDKTGFQYEATVTEGSNIVTLDITQQMTAVSGKVVCELVITSGDDRIATVNFILFVEAAALDEDTVISETDLPLIEEAAELAQRIDGIVADVEADADRAEAAADNAELWASRNPYIGSNGNWFVFDSTTEQYVDTQIAATGPQGPQGDDGPTGPQGPTGPTGNGIVSITKTGTSGLVDTYTILFTDGSTTTFTVTNGQDGQGSGDMTKAVYDSTNAVADAGGIVAYVAAHSGAGTLAGLDDVTLSSLAAGDTIIYNATTQKWENSTVIQTLTNQVKDMNNVYGSKNLLRQVNNGAKTTGGITFTPNDDGSITLSGTASSSAQYYYPANGTTSISDDWEGVGVWLPKGNYIVSGGIETQNGDLQVIDVTEHTITSIVGAVVDDTPFTLTKDTLVAVRIRVNANKTASGTAYPMIRLASITDDTYEPYAKTNQQLTEETTSLLDNLEVNGAVNMLPNNATTQTINGITFTVNDDGSVTCNGTATATAVLFMFGTSSAALENIYKNMKLSGCPSGGDTSTYQLMAQTFSTSAPSSGTDYHDVGEGIILGTASYIRVYIRIASGTTVSNLTFKPMITVASYNGDYVPYAKSNRELTEDVANIKGKYIIDSTSSSVTVTSDGVKTYQEILHELLELASTKVSTYGNNCRGRIMNLQVYVPELDNTTVIPEANAFYTKNIENPLSSDVNTFCKGFTYNSPQNKAYLISARLHYTLANCTYTIIDAFTNTIISHDTDVVPSGKTFAVTLLVYEQLS